MLLLLLLLLLLLSLLLLSLTLPLLKSDAPASSADPEGAAHGWAAIFDRARMASRKIPERMKGRICLVGESFFFGSVSFVD